MVRAPGDGELQGLSAAAAVLCPQSPLGLAKDTLTFAVDCDVPATVQIIPHVEPQVIGPVLRPSDDQNLD
jgi:hypothetical protein